MASMMGLNLTYRTIHPLGRYWELNIEIVHRLHAGQLTSEGRKASFGKHIFRCFH